MVIVSKLLDTENRLSEESKKIHLNMYFFVKDRSDDGLFTA